MDWLQRLNPFAGPERGGGSGPSGGRGRINPAHPSLHDQAMGVAQDRRMPGPQSAQFNRVIGEALMPNLFNQLNRVGGQEVPVFDPSLTGQDVAHGAGYEGLPAALLGAGIDTTTPGGPLDRVMDAGKMLAFAAAVVPPSLLKRLGRIFGNVDPSDRTFRRLPRGEEDAYLEIQRALPEGARDFVTQYTPDELSAKIARGARVYAHPSGAGFVIDGVDIQGVVNAGGVRGLGQDAMRQAIREGGRTLDAFDVPADRAGGINLPTYYGRFGFREVNRIQWDDAYAPAGWNYERYGRPDIVFMELIDEALP